MHIRKYSTSVLINPLLYILVLVVGISSRKSFAKDIPDQSVRIKDGKITYEVPGIRTNAHCHGIMRYKHCN